MKKAFIAFGLVAACSLAKAQTTYNAVDSLPEFNLNWYNNAPDNTKISGVAVDRAYSELLKGKTPKKKIIVAVIDSGVDTDHEDLVDNIWVNADEIADNGIDDDGNGYVDDINGWNFLGGTDGEMIVKECLEYTRIVRDYKDKFEGKSLAQIPNSQKDNFKMYTRAKKEFDQNLQLYERQEKIFGKALENYEFSEKLMEAALQDEDFTTEDLQNFKTEDLDMLRAKNIVLSARTQGFDKVLYQITDRVDLFLDYHLNLEFDGREISGDDKDDLDDRDYGNNNVEGAEADHGTFVSSLIAANRENAIGIEGIASNVEIMALRAVPQGDEYDKDIALAIRYAVDNGANIINMSFGKSFSPHKPWVDEAMQYAADNNVLLVHAAGNDSKNNDIDPSYPNDKTLDEQIISTWLEIGANSSDNRKELCGGFSNYGVRDVDFFAPGVDVIGCTPNDEYTMLNGTSFACPVTSGVAALVWSYYPELTALELKEILMESTHDMGRRRVIIPGEKRKKTRFRNLSVTGGIVNAYNALQMAELKS